MNEEKINKFIEDEMDDGLGVQFVDGERFFGLDYKYDGGFLVFDKTQQIIDDCDWWDVVPMNNIQTIQLLNELYVENQQLKDEKDGYLNDALIFRGFLEDIAKQLEPFSRVPALEHAVDNWRNQANLMTQEYVKLNNKYREECHNESIIKKTKGE